MRRASWIIGLTLLCGCGPESPTGSADLLLLAGKILTVDAEFTVVEALAVQDNRILAVGDSDAMQTLPSTSLKIPAPGDQTQ